MPIQSETHYDERARITSRAASEAKSDRTESVAFFGLKKRYYYGKHYRQDSQTNSPPNVPLIVV